MKNENVYYYLLAIISNIFLPRHEVARNSLSKNDIYNLIGLSVFSSIVGVRVYYVAFN